MLATLFAPFVLGLLSALVAGWVAVPVLRKLKARQAISTDAPASHQSKSGTPTMGGVIILAAMLVPALCFRPVSVAGSQIWGVLLTTLAFAAIGFLDDFLIVKRGKNLGLRAREKLAAQFVVSMAFAVWHWKFATPSVAELATQPGWIPGVFAAYHVLLLVGLSNAVNLTDGLDGLAAGVTLPVWAFLALGAAFWASAAPMLGSGVQDPGVAVLCAGFAGATVGYLWYNAHPALIFMGDTGSLAIGGGLGAAAIALRLDWLILLAAVVPLVEAASVTLQVISFKTTGKRIFKMSPLHHHFELCKWPETRIVARFCIASALSSGLALAALFWKG